MTTHTDRDRHTAQHKQPHPCRSYKDRH